MSLIRKPTRDGFVVPMAAALGLAIALLVAGALEFIRVRTQDIALIRGQAEALPTLRSVLGLTGLLLRITPRDSSGFTPDEALGRRVLGIKDDRILFDGTPITILFSERPVQISIQDEAGLAPINAMSVEELERFLMANGVPREAAQTFSAESSDFRDFDNDRQPNGAERDEYRRKGLVGPKNWAFNYSGELGQILSASALRQDIGPEVIARLGFERSGRINLNAVSPTLLKSAFGFSESSVSRIIEERKVRSLQGADFQAYPHRSETRLDQRISAGTSNRFRIIVTDITTKSTLRRTILIESATTSEGFFGTSSGASKGSNLISSQRSQAIRMLDQEIIDLH